MLLRDHEARFCDIDNGSAEAWIHDQSDVVAMEVDVEIHLDVAQCIREYLVGDRPGVHETHA